MPAAIVRADYAQLHQAVLDFRQQAAALRQALQSLQREADTLQAGDWLGRGAQAFYAEMGGQVLPTLNRLVRALEAAATTTSQVSQAAQQAEQEAAACFRLDGAGAGVAAAALGGGAGAGAPGGAASISSGASAFVGGQGGAAAAKPAPPKAPVAPVVKDHLDAKGQAAFDQYLKDYRASLRAQSQAWDAATVSQKAQDIRQKGEKWAKVKQPEVGRLTNQLLDQAGRGAVDPALKKKVLDLMQQNRNEIQQALIESEVMLERASDLRAEAQKIARQGGPLTKAQNQALADADRAFGDVRGAFGPFGDMQAYQDQLQIFIRQQFGS